MTTGRGAEGWYLLRDGDPHGPLHEADIRQRRLHGELAPTDKVWRAGLKEWVPATELDALLTMPSSEEPAASDTHYVIVVHGTFDAPRDGVPMWHRLEEGEKNFCRGLNDKLDARGMGRPVWRDVGGGTFHFHWSAENRHSARVRGGDELAARIRDITAKDPTARIHIVAHSHGCNVVLAAVGRYLASLEADAGRFHSAMSDFWSSPHSAKLTLPEHLASRLGSTPSRWLLGEVTGQLRRTSRLRRYFQRKPGANLRAETQRRWVSESDTNRIARLVFMGAPFLRKVWRKRAWWDPSTLFGHAIDAAAAVPLGIVTSYLLIEMLWVLYVWGPGMLLSFFVSFDTGIITPRLNPWAWPLWLWVVAGLLVTFYTGALFSSFEGWVRRDTNIYFDLKDIPRLSKGKIEESAMPYTTLNINAGPLDEVLLGFSTEPMVFGTLAPQLREMLSPPNAFKAERLPIGLAISPRLFFVRWLGVVQRVILAAIMWMLTPVRRRWERRLTNQLMTIVASPAFGLAPREFRDAMIVPDSKINLPEYFVEHVWDVSRHLAKLPPVIAAAQDATAERYRFVWDQEERERRKKGSWAWKRLEPSLPELRRRHSAFALGASDDSLVVTCLMLEERLREVFGFVQIVHGTYYTDDVIVERIADFLAGQDPANLDIYSRAEE